jgi:hypothetical protein
MAGCSDDEAHGHIQIVFTGVYLSAVLLPKCVGTFEGVTEIIKKESKSRRHNKREMKIERKV